MPILDFNDVLGLDVIHLEDALGHRHLGLSMVGYASTYHLVVGIGDTKAATITEAVRKSWIAWAGPLEPLRSTWIRDSKTSLTSFAPSATPTCLMQRAKRTGSVGWWNAIMECGKLCGRRWSRRTPWWAMGIDSVNNAKNLLRNKDGYSPRQWVFGVNPRLLNR